MEGEIRITELDYVGLFNLINSVRDKKFIIMEKGKIGQDAGIIWQEIDAHGEMSATELKKSTKMDIKDIYLALGWLARENKVFFNTKKGELYISLIYEAKCLPGERQEIMEYWNIRISLLYRQYNF